MNSRYRLLITALLLACRREAIPSRDTSQSAVLAAGGTGAQPAVALDSSAPHSEHVRAAGASTALKDSAPRIPLIPSPEDDSLFVATSGIAPRLLPLAASLDSMVLVLRADSATLRADSSFLGFRREFARSVDAVVRTFDDPEFQRLMTNYLEQLLHGPYGVPPRHPVVADSLMRLFRQFGIRSYPAEGVAYFVPADDVLLARMGAFITEPMREYLRIEILEYRRPLGYDGSRAVPLDEISDRLAATDRLLMNHPDTPVRAALTDHYRRYLGYYMTGGHNTPFFEARRSWVIDSAVRRAYARHLSRHGSTTSAQVIAEYLTLLEASGFRPSAPVVAFIEEKSGWVIKAR